MSRKLGEILVGAGKITEAQLHRALTAQLVFGGHLGTSLLELGHIDEETLGETLSGMFNVPYADFDTLSRVPNTVVRALPAKLIDKHQVVPLRLEGKVLHLAMIDPKNLVALDEISFVTGYRIVAWVSPEVRIVQMMDIYYGIARTQRFTVLGRELSRLRSRREKLRPLQGDEPLPGAAEPARPLAAAAIEAGGARPASVPRGAAAAVATGYPPAPLPADHWEKYGYGRSWREVAESLEAGQLEGTVRAEEVDTRPQPRTRSGPAGTTVAPTGHPSLLEAARRLAAAESVEEVVSTTLAHVGASLDHGIFFVLKKDRAVGWAGHGEDLTEPSVRRLALPLTEPGSLFELVRPGMTHYLGPPPPAQAAGRFFDELDLQVPRSMMLIPIAVKERVTAWLYADGGSREILPTESPALLTLCARAGLALHILVLRNKILTS